MAAILRYDAALAPLVYAASDLFLMPSRFEPCGLGQMIAMRYGAVPVVRATGGLVDTVHEGDTGFSFGPYTAEAFWSALTRAMNLYYSDRAAWREMIAQRHGRRLLVGDLCARVRAGLHVGDRASAGLVVPGPTWRARASGGRGPQPAGTPRADPRWAPSS